MTMKTKIRLVIKRLFYKRIPIQVLDEQGKFICCTWAWICK